MNSQALLDKVENSPAGLGVNVMAATPEAIIDLKKHGIVDPAKVTKEAVSSAISIAATAITMGALIVDLPEKPTSSPSMDGGMAGMY